MRCRLEKISLQSTSPATVGFSPVSLFWYFFMMSTILIFLRQEPHSEDPPCKPRIAYGAAVSKNPDHTTYATKSFTKSLDANQTFKEILGHKQVKVMIQKNDNARHLYAQNSNNPLLQFWKLRVSEISNELVHRAKICFAKQNAISAIKNKYLIN